MILCITSVFHNLKLILFLQDQIQLEYIHICSFPVVAIRGAPLLPTLPHLPWYVTINNSMRCVWPIYCSSAAQMHNKALWTSFLFKHGSWCVSFTCLYFCFCKLTSHTREEKTLTNKISTIFFSSSFSFSSFSLPFAVFSASFSILFFLFRPSANVDPYWLVLVSSISTSFYVPHASNKGNVHQDWVF